MRKPGSDAMESIVYSLCKRVDSPRSLAVWLCFKYNQGALMELPLPATATEDKASFQLDYFLTEYLTKYKGLDTGANKRQVALDKWILTEQLCRETNMQFRDYQLRPATGRVDSALFRAQRKIAAVLGKLSLPTVFADCKWGPGATFDMSREEATPDKKISQAISVTGSALPFLRAVVESDPHWSACFLGVIPEGPFRLTQDCFTIVKGSRFLTVAKSAKTDRCIAAEPTGNSFLQQGIHSYMRRRLKRFGVDLDDQSINQELARDAFRSGLSTLDLSAASDTISRELVAHLLPLDWFLLLDSLRSPETLVDGKWIRTEKFASMGNAFCFELETLIFWAVCCSVAEDRGRSGSVSVYGDDIIVDRKDFDASVEILEYCGFTVNKKKSFKDGNFFESCGKHFFRGEDVTPIYQKERLNHPSELIRAHNRLIRLSSRLLVTDGVAYVRGACRAITEMYSLRPFPRIPYGCSGDGGFLRPSSEFSLDPNHGFRVHVLEYRPRFTEAREDAMYAYKLRRSQHQNPEPRGYVANVTKGAWRTRVRWVSELASRDENSLVLACQKT